MSILLQTPYTMNKSKFLIAVIVVLFISNGILFFMFLKAPERHEGPKQIIIEKLGFDKNQVIQYEKLIQKHRQYVRDNELKMNELRTDLYSHLMSADSDSFDFESMILNISKQQALAEKINFSHFLEIKKLCKPEQMQRFELLTKEIAELFSKKPRK